MSSDLLLFGPAQGHGDPWRDRTGEADTKAASAIREAAKATLDCPPYKPPKSYFKADNHGHVRRAPLWYWPDEDQDGN